MNTTPWIEYKENGQRYRIRATYGWHMIQGNPGPYWSVTGETDRYERGKWREDSGGCLHDEVTKYFPRLAPTIKWHLCDSRGPMHYEANARYWLEKVKGVSKWPPSLGEPEPLEAFKSTVVFGALPEDRDVPDLPNLTAWCAARLPALLEAMRRDTEAVLVGVPS